MSAAGLCSVDPKRVCWLNRGSSVRWNRGGHDRNDKQHQADGDEHDRIVQIADRPLGDNLVEPHAQGETREEARDDGEDRRLTDLCLCFAVIAENKRKVAALVAEKR